MSNRRQKSKQQNTLNSQLVQPEERVKERNENLIQLGKFFYSLSGMTYAGAVLTFVVDFDKDNTNELLMALLGLVLLAAVGWIFVRRGNIKK